MNQKSKNYWAKRTWQSEKRANALGEQLVKKYNKAYVRSYRRVLREIETLATKATVSIDDISRTELYDYGRMINLRDVIEKEFTDLTVGMRSDAELMLSKVYESTLQGAAKDFGMEFVKPNEFQVKAVVNELYKGSNYSERIWHNNKALAGRVHMDMERMVLQGKSPQAISKQLQKDFNVGHSNSERLIRTEASRVYNEARIDSYEEFGIDQVEFLAEAGACDVCGDYDGKVYATGQGPGVPVHPRCRCTYLPIID